MPSSCGTRARRKSELEGKEIAATVNRAMDALPADLRTAITLREIEGLSYEEIASVMNCPVGTVRSRIFRARDAIAAELRPLLGTEERSEMVMREQISRLMDGDLEGAEADAAFRELKRVDGLEYWMCYHVIGDALRRNGAPIAGFAERFAARLDAEPTVLAPKPVARLPGCRSPGRSPLR